MLSRTADHLFWMSRYTERAENTARMLDVNYQTSMLPRSASSALVGWEGLLSISELKPAYTAKYGTVIKQRDVMDFMVKDETNSSSIVSRNPDDRGLGKRKRNLPGCHQNAAQWRI
jgi:uncharacterized alpha-E superfamily protein